MDTLEMNKKSSGFFSREILFGIAVGVIVIAIGIWLLSQRPSVDDQVSSVLAAALREDSPEFAAITKDIIISTDDDTVESPTGLGTISMFIKGNIRNKGTKTITILEVNVAVVDQQNNVLKEKRVLVIPRLHETLGPNQTVEATLAMEGFDRKADRANIRWKVTALKTAD